MPRCQFYNSLIEIDNYVSTWVIELCEISIRLTEPTLDMYSHKSTNETCLVGQLFEYFLNVSY